MDWKDILNPWGEVRRLRERVAYLEGQIDHVESWAAKTEERAYRAVADQYWHRQRVLEEQNKALMANAAQMASYASPTIVASTLNARSPALSGLIAADAHMIDGEQ